MTNYLPPPRIDLLIYAPSSSSLLPTLSTLLEPSPSLIKLLIPQLHLTLQSLQRSTPNHLPKSYHDLLDLCSYLVAGWDVEDQAIFIAAHPRIGETKGLSKASSFEQGNLSSSTTAATAASTPGEVLKRLGVSYYCLLFLLVL